MSLTAVTGSPASLVGVADEPPRPIYTLLIEGDHGGTPAFAVVRHWTPEDAGACRLCWVCETKVGPPGFTHDGRRTRTVVCVTGAKGTPPATREGLDAFSPDGLLP